MLKAQGAAGWDWDPAAREVELGWALTALGPLAGKRVLELGCGPGNAAPWFVERGCAYTGVDISPAAITWANERAVPGAAFRVGDVTHGIDGAYDLVVDGHCLHCIIGPDRTRLLTHVRGALVPGGHLFVATMCGAVTSPALQACFDAASRCQVVDGVARRFIGDADGILAELRAAGFEVVASVVDPRDDANDQDHLWALVR